MWWTLLAVYLSVGTTLVVYEGVRFRRPKGYPVVYAALDAVIWLPVLFWKLIKG